MRPEPLDPREDLQRKATLATARADVPHEFMPDTVGLRGYRTHMDPMTMPCTGCDRPISARVHRVVRTEGGYYGGP